MVTKPTKPETSPATSTDGPLTEEERLLQAAELYEEYKRRSDPKNLTPSQWQEREARLKYADEMVSKGLWVERVYPPNPKNRTRS